MNPTPHQVVALVLTDDFASQLLPLAQRASVWITGTPVNRAEAERIWATKGGEDITSFTPISGATVEGVAALVDNIELHHGHFSCNPPYDTIEVMGAELSSELREMLAARGFGLFTTTETGFIALLSCRC